MQQRAFLGLVTILVFFSPLLRAERLLLGGGAGSPASAYDAFFQWGRGAQGLYYVVTWGTIYGQAYLDSIKAEAVLRGVSPERVYEAPSLEKMLEDADARKQFSSELLKVTGIYFSGGDQRLYMEVFLRFPTLKNLLKYQVEKKSLVYMGISAGAMLAGRKMAYPLEKEQDGPKDVPFFLIEGVGLFPGIVESHAFGRPGRVERACKSLTKANQIGLPAVAIGENAFLAMNKNVVVVHGNGDSQVALISRRVQNQIESFTQHWLKPRQGFKFAASR